MNRGEIWIGNLNPNRGNEIGKIRPVLIIQANELLHGGSPTVIVLPLTTQIDPAKSLSRVLVRARDRLKHDCQILVAQPRTLDRARISDGPATRLTENELQAVERSLLAVLGLF